MNDLEQVSQLTPIPSEIDIVPLFGMVIYPQTVIPLAMAQPSAVRLFDDPASGTRLVGMIALRANDHRPDRIHPADWYTIGTVALVHRLLRLPDETLRVAVQGLERFVIKDILSDTDVIRARISMLPEPSIQATTSYADIIITLKELVTRIACLVPSFNQELLNQITNEDDPRRLSYLIAATLSWHRLPERQQLLEHTDVQSRLEHLRQILTQELAMLRSTHSPETASDHIISLSHRAFSIAAANVSVMPGSAIWLRRSSVGGEATTIEALQMPGRGNIIITGSPRAAIRDIAQIALSWIRAHTEPLGLEARFHESIDLHLNLPFGTPADEIDSVGLVVVVTLMSLLSARSIARGVALAGEITLHGRVLPISRVREKILAVQRVGIPTVVLPAGNADDLDNLPEHIRQHLTFLFVHRIEEALRIALPPSNPIADYPKNDRYH